MALLVVQQTRQDDEACELACITYSALSNCASAMMERGLSLYTVRIGSLDSGVDGGGACLL